MPPSTNYKIIFVPWRGKLKIDNVKCLGLLGAGVAGAHLLDVDAKARGLPACGNAECQDNDV
jgi:hypothetical protein